jgi:hypothetical protein
MYIYIYTHTHIHIYHAHMQEKNSLKTELKKIMATVKWQAMQCKADVTHTVHIDTVHIGALGSVQCIFMQRRFIQCRHEH